MPVIYYNIDEQKSLEKEPYKSLTKRFKNLKNALEEKEIELSIGADKEGFSKGFYTDFEFTNDAKVKFIFSKEAETGLRGEKPKIFVRMIFSFECTGSYQRKQVIDNFINKSSPPGNRWGFLSLFVFSVIE